MQKKRLLLCSLAVTALFAGTVDAKVSKQEAAKLGSELTPFGAIKEGNKDGTIPKWDGGFKTPPKEYQRPGQHHPDPFKADKVKFRTLEDGTKVRIYKSTGEMIDA